MKHLITNATFILQETGQAILIEQTVDDTKIIAAGYIDGSSIVEKKELRFKDGVGFDSSGEEYSFEPA